MLTFLIIYVIIIQDKKTPCLFLGDGLVIRLDEHRKIVMGMTSLAQSVVEGTTGVRARRHAVWDSVFLNFFPGPTCDVEVLSNPLGRRDAQPKFTSKR